jgi:membrane protein required for colicin V production
MNHIVSFAGLTLFDFAAGLTLLVSALVGWIRGGTREVTTVAALVIAAIAAFLALRYSGPIARHAIHTVWMANIAALLIVFVAVYILLRAIASALTRGVQRVGGLSGLDRMVGAGFGVLRALVVLGLANLTINAITPPERMPAWISGAKLYPLSTLSARALKSFAPPGFKFARQMAPVIGHAVTEGDETNSAENRDYNAPSPQSLDVRVEKSR